MSHIPEPPNDDPRWTLQYVYGFPVWVIEESMVIPDAPDGLDDVGLYMAALMVTTPGLSITIIGGPEASLIDPVGGTDEEAFRGWLATARPEAL